MNKNLLLLSAAIISIPSTFDPGKTGWKTDADGNLELKDGNPIYIDSQGTEMVTEHGTISRLNAEAKANREGREQAETKLKAFDGIDIEVAKKAIKTVEGLDAKKLIDAGELERVKLEVGENYKTQLTEKDSALKTANETIDDMRLDRVFESSQYIKDNIAVPVEMVRSTFGANFKVEENKVFAVGADGNRLMSKERVGEYATNEEAFSILVDNYAHKDSILKSEGKSGTGNDGNGGNNTNKGNTMKRSDFNQLSVSKQAELVQAGETTIVA